MLAALRQADKLTPEEIYTVDTTFIPVFKEVCIYRTSTSTSALDAVTSSLEAIIFTHSGV
jgi:hypothetical protein